MLPLCDSGCVFHLSEPRFSNLWNGHDSPPSGSGGTQLDPQSPSAPSGVSRLSGETLFPPHPGKPALLSWAFQFWELCHFLESPGTFSWNDFPHPEALEMGLFLELNALQLTVLPVNRDLVLKFSSSAKSEHNHARSVSGL